MKIDDRQIENQELSGSADTMISSPKCDFHINDLAIATW